MSDPSSFQAKPSHLVKQLIKAGPERGGAIESLGTQHFADGRIDAGLRDRFMELADALRNYDEKTKRKKLESADAEQRSTKRPRPG